MQTKENSDYIYSNGIQNYVIMTNGLFLLFYSHFYHINSKVLEFIKKKTAALVKLVIAGVH